MSIEQQPESEILNRIRIARSPESEAETVTEEAETDEVEFAEEDTQETEGEETTEEVEEQDELEETDEQATEDDEELFVDVGGKEVSLKDIESWEASKDKFESLERETEELNEAKKALQDQANQLNTQYTEQQTKLSELTSELEAIISEETLSADALKELREDDPDAFIDYQDKLQKRQAALTKAKAKATSQRNPVNKQQVNDGLVAANPHWLKDGKPTDGFTNDMAKVKSYVGEIGYPADELAEIESNGDLHHWTTLLDAARGKEAIKELERIKSAAQTKRSKKVLVTTKSSSKGDSSLERQIKQAKAKFDKSGNVEDAYALRKLQKKLKESN